MSQLSCAAVDENGLLHVVSLVDQVDTSVVEGGTFRLRQLYRREMRKGCLIPRSQ